MTRIILTTAAFAAISTAVLAHSKSEETTPANDATVQAVDIIEIR